MKNRLAHAGGGSPRDLPVYIETWYRLVKRRHSTGRGTTRCQRSTNGSCRKPRSLLSTHASIKSGQAHSGCWTGLADPLPSVSMFKRTATGSIRSTGSVTLGVIRGTTARMAIADEDFRALEDLASGEEGTWQASGLANRFSKPCRMRPSLKGNVCLRSGVAPKPSQYGAGRIWARPSTRRRIATTVRGNQCYTFAPTKAVCAARRLVVSAFKSTRSISAACESLILHIGQTPTFCMLPSTWPSASG